MKNKQIKKIIILCLITVTSNQPLQAISKFTAQVGTVTVALGSAISSYQGYYAANTAIHPLCFGIASTMATFATHRFLHKVTPEGRLKRAHKLLDDLSRHKLIKNSFNDDKSFFDAVHDIYLTDDLPLISSYNHLITLLPIAHSAFGLISKATAEVGRNSLLQEECDSACSRAKALFANMSQAIKRIREHKDYLAQLQIYKEFLANEKHVALQERIASSQSQMAHAQQSSTFLKWLKAFFWGK